MQNLIKEKVQAELQLQKSRYERQLESVKQIGNEMTNLIKSNFNEKITMILQEQWTKQCQIRELKSIKKFSKKEQWFKEDWMSTSKEQHGSVRDPNKQENSRQCRILCVKSVQIRSFSGPYFPAYGLNTDIWTRKNSLLGHFSRRDI